MKNLSLNRKVGIGGRAKAWVINPDGSVAQETGWSKNLVLDSGFQEGVNRSFSELCRYCAVGTDNAQRTATQTLLGNEVQRTGNCENVDGFNTALISDVGVTPHDYTIRRTFDFTKGDLDSSSDGLYYEAGFSWNDLVGETLFSSVLFRDDQDNVLGVDVDTTQILRVRYELIFRLEPATETSDTFDITNIGTINYTHKIQDTRNSTGADIVGTLFSGVDEFNGSVVNNTSNNTSSRKGWIDDNKNGYREALWEPANPYAEIYITEILAGAPTFADVGEEDTFGMDTSSFNETTETANITDTSFDLASLTYSKTWRFQVDEGNGEVGVISMGRFYDAKWAAIIDGADRFEKADTHELELTFNLVMERL